MRLTRSFRVALLLAGLFVVGAGAVCLPAAAQTTRTLAIRDGGVYIDGRAVPRDQLPASLDVRGVVASYSFSGDLKPILDLNGVLYTLDGATLREAGLPAKGQAAVFFGEPGTGLPATFSRGHGTPGGDRSTFFSMKTIEGREGGFVTRVRGVRMDAPEVVIMQQHARALERQAEDIQQLRDVLHEKGGSAYVAEIDRSADRLRAQAAEAASMAEELPLLPVRSYLNEVESENRELFERLVAEREMEGETMRLAREINTLAPGRQREARTEALRQKLREIFELKQDNRRREIAHLEKELVGLRGRLQTRERLRDQIIEQRLEQLLALQGR